MVTWEPTGSFQDHCMFRLANLKHSKENRLNLFSARVLGSDLLFTLLREEQCPLIYKITKASNRRIVANSGKHFVLSVQLQAESTFIHVVISWNVNKTSSTSMRFTEYNKMQVQIRFVVIKAQHGVSARKSVETHHTSKEKRSLDRNRLCDLTILLVQLTSRIARRPSNIFITTHTISNLKLNLQKIKQAKSERTIATDAHIWRTVSDAFLVASTFRLGSVRITRVRAHNEQAPLVLLRVTKWQTIVYQRLT